MTRPASQKTDRKKKKIIIHPKMVTTGSTTFKNRRPDTSGRRIPHDYSKPLKFKNLSLIPLYRKVLPTGFVHYMLNLEVVPQAHCVKEMPEAVAEMETRRC